MVVITSLLPEEGFLVSAPLFILIVFFNLIYLFLFYFWLCSVFVVAHGLSLAVMILGCSFVAMHGLLTVVASLVAENRL